MPTDVMGADAHNTTIDRDDIDAPWTSKCRSKAGILFIHHRGDGAEGYIFIPSSKELPQRVFDPNSKNITLDLHSEPQYKTTTLRDFGESVLRIEEVVKNLEVIESGSKPKGLGACYAWKYSRTFHVE